jgi:hypothetical protein
VPKAPSAVVLIRALKFIPNPATAADNAFQRLTVHRRKVVPLTEKQIHEFAGNAVELSGRTRNGKRRSIMAMSARARQSLTPDQVAAVEESCEIVSVDIPTIVLAGGSVRCMIAGVHLDPRRTAAELELTEAVEAINEEHPTTADGPDVAMADVHA